VLFDDVEEWSGEFDATVRWDPTLGFPVYADFDDGYTHTGFQVSEFHPAP
jgi:hypothetical protein